MTQEEKILVFNDLSARLVYGVKVKITINNKDYPDFGGEEVGTVRGLLCFPDEDDSNKFYFTVVTNYDTTRSQGQNVEDVKPYLRPLSSMTEKEKNELFNLCTMYNGGVNTDWKGFGIYIIDTHPRYGDSFFTDYSAIDWLNKKMFDYRGLIPKGLALTAPEGMYETHKNEDNGEEQ
jgi:hypothetical protein